ncbi:hypothetical protein M3172_08790 [Mesobacillus subterraneus]|uniref:hypothetical protein n=1 Tax=Mesobacillus subterraneus TaxID=285983 RepID=UPI002040D5F2|nr:hypothetical protein [Mesobacillus subterraneus]MCM3573290.1 hypothetical protein [Mesobacillus subterraneus]
MELKHVKVAFISEDGERFQLFVEGKEIAITHGITITAGGGHPVEVTPTMRFISDKDTIQEP